MPVNRQYTVQHATCTRYQVQVQREIERVGRETDPCTVQYCTYCTVLGLLEMENCTSTVSTRYSFYSTTSTSSRLVEKRGGERRVQGRFTQTIISLDTSVLVQVQVQ